MAFFLIIKVIALKFFIQECIFKQSYTVFIRISIA
jgi:hypothetical protein